MVTSYIKFLCIFEMSGCNVSSMSDPYLKAAIFVHFMLSSEMHSLMYFAHGDGA